jgi:hypothetical protein
MRPTDFLARIAYQAYGETTDFKNYQGYAMPEFDDLGETIQKAWDQAARRVEQQIRDDVEFALARVMGGS